MDNVCERIETARDRQGNVGETDRLLASAVMILGELRAALDLPRGGSVAASLDDLYDYMCRRLNAADLPHGFAALDEVSHLLHALRSAWAFMPPEVRVASGNRGSKVAASGRGA
jgi:flagellar protein FliS